MLFDARARRHQQPLLGVVVDRREVDLRAPVAGDRDRVDDDVDLALLDERKSLGHGQRDEPHVALGGAEDRRGHLVHEVDLEPLDVPGGGVQVAELVEPRVDAGDEVALLVDLGHEAAGGHVVRRGQRRRRTQARGGVLAVRPLGCSATAGAVGVGVASAPRVRFSAWSEVAPQPASVAATSASPAQVCGAAVSSVLVDPLPKPDQRQHRGEHGDQRDRERQPVERGGGVGRRPREPTLRGVDLLRRGCGSSPRRSPMPVARARSRSVSWPPFSSRLISRAFAWYAAYSASNF